MIVVMVLHVDTHGFWADSEDVAGYTAVADTPLAVMDLVNEAERLGMLGDDVDLRWVPCGKPLAALVAVSPGLGIPRSQPCECAA